jgi:FkbM family methyltransferase
MYQQVFVSEEYACTSALQVEPKSIIDAGANVGYTAVWFANRYPKAVIISVEPDEANYQLLVKNTWHLNNYRCDRSALWGETSTLSMSNQKYRDGSACAQTVSVTPGDVQAKTIADIIKFDSLEKPILVKIDIEGAESSVFLDDRSDSWLPNVYAVILEVHEDSIFGNPSMDIENAMTRHGFSYVMSGELRMYTRVESPKVV